jgi:hypothetical protein
MNTEVVSFVWLFGFSFISHYHLQVPCTNPRSWQSPAVLLLLHCKIWGKKSVATYGHGCGCQWPTWTQVSQFLLGCAKYHLECDIGVPTRVGIWLGKYFEHRFWKHWKKSWKHKTSGQITTVLLCFVKECGQMKWESCEGQVDRWKTDWQLGYHMVKGLVMSAL